MKDKFIIIIYLLLILQTLGFGILALIAELYEIKWLTLVFLIMMILSLSSPKIEYFTRKIRK